MLSNRARGEAKKLRSKKKWRKERTELACFSPTSRARSSTTDAMVDQRLSRRRPGAPPTGLALGANCSIEEIYCRSRIGPDPALRRLPSTFRSSYGNRGNGRIWQFSCGLEKGTGWTEFAAEDRVQRRSWFRVLAIAAPAALIAAVAIAMFVVRASVGSDVGPRTEVRAADLAKDAGSVRQTAIPVSVRTQTFSGVITDDHCGARHDMRSNKSPSECTAACLRHGANYILVNGDKSYRLEGNADELARFSGTRVTLTGSLKGNRINVSSVAWE